MGDEIEKIGTFVSLVVQRQPSNGKWRPNEATQQDFIQNTRIHIIKQYKRGLSSM